MSPEYGVGDRVIVSYTGFVEEADESEFLAGDSWHSQEPQRGRSVVVLERAKPVKKPVAVGDVLTGPEVQFGPLPVGSVVTYTTPYGDRPWFRGVDGWISQTGRSGDTLREDGAFRVDYIAPKV